MKKILFFALLLYAVIPLMAQKQIVAWEYWFDKDVSQKVTQAVSPGDSLVISGHVDISSLARGMHTLNTRFLDNGGTWSSVASSMFYVADTTTRIPRVPVPNQIVAWEYWWDKADSLRITQAVTSSDNLLILDHLDISSLDRGLHTLNSRFLNSKGTWSSVASSMFFIPDTTPRLPRVPVQRQIVAWEYWWDKADSLKITAQVSPSDSLIISDLFNTSSLTRGLHTLNSRYLDNFGSWSGVTSSMFFIEDTLAPLPREVFENKIVAYRFWFNQDINKYNTFALSQPVDSLVLTSIMLQGIGNGTHAFHMQFQDSLGRWTGTYTDTITVLFTPGAAGAINGPAHLCSSQDSMVFSVPPVLHATSYVWTLPSWMTGSSDSNSIIVFFGDSPMSGDISVYGVNSEGVGLPSSMQVSLNTSPTVMISGDSDIEYGQSVTLNAIPSPAGTYEFVWSPDGDLSNSITKTPLTTTTYIVSITDVGSMCEAIAHFTVNLPPPVMPRLKVLLQGAWSTVQNNMTTTLNTLGYLPTSQPYNTSPWSYSGQETLDNIPATMTDWVLVEIRSSANTAVERRAALLLSDGRITDVDGQPGVAFNAEAGQYYVAVHHRNHLPVMTKQSISFPFTATIDLTDTLNFPVNGRCVFDVANGKSAMIVGDINHDNQLKYSGSQNDRNLILSRILGITGGTAITAIANGYFTEDLNMNGQVRYSGQGNDPSLIIQNLVQLTGSGAINSTFQGSVP